MPKSLSTRIRRNALAAAGLVLALVTLAPSAAAQRGLGAAASVALTVTVPASLEVLAVVPVQGDTVDAMVVITERVHVRGNVSHRLVARRSTDAGTEVRVRRGEWALVAGTGVGIATTDVTGETTHLVQCRRPLAAVVAASGCGLSFELVSTDPAWPASSRLSIATR